MIAITDNLPFRAPDNVHQRHDEILTLRDKGATLQQCAERVGLHDHSSALYHINGECRCNGTGARAAGTSRQAQG